MALMVGIVLAVAVGLFGTTVGLDRDRAFYPTITVVVASLYCLFATLGGSTRVLLLETAVAALFIVAAAVGFRTSLWIVAVALAGHGLLDMVHDRLIDNPGVPTFWPAFCASYDVVAGIYLAWRLRSGGIPVRA